MDETVLLGIGADNTANLFCASAISAAWLRAPMTSSSRYYSMFGPHAPPVGSVGQSNYEGLRFLETVANRAGSLGLRPLLKARATRSTRPPAAP